MQDMTLQGFLDDLASRNPTPGGGGAAAVMGAMGAALLSMVANLTLGKKGYESVQDDMLEQLAQSEALRVRFVALVAQDAAAFNQLMAGYRLPKESEAEKVQRAEAIQKGLKAATQVPLRCAQACAEAIRLAQRSAATGHHNVISDTGAGVLSLLAALRSAALNVDINLPSIQDASFAGTVRAQTDALLEECIPLAESVHAAVKQRLL